MVLASQTPPKTRRKSFQNRRSKKHGIFHRFLFDFCCLLQEPTSISYWFLQYKMALGRFSSSCFLHGFGVQKNLPKTLEKRCPNPSKIDAKNMLFFNIHFYGFWLRFWKILWASELPKNRKKIWSGYGLKVLR